ncbi:MAG: hypothetical protein VKI42_06810 [Synechococcaceae cyanobacterium]|nr:hypothetical protein [Synechococcaceae cyanobacterium]
MGNRPSCRSCRHCLPPSGMQLGWCQLRQLPIHPDLVSELWCPHWTVRPPRLPSLNPSSSADSERVGREEQLSLPSMLAEF